MKITHILKTHHSCKECIGSRVSFGRRGRSGKPRREGGREGGREGRRI